MESDIFQTQRRQVTNAYLSLEKDNILEHSKTNTFVWSNITIVLLYREKQVTHIFSFHILYLGIHFNSPDGPVSIPDLGE